MTAVGPRNFGHWLLSRARRHGCLHDAATGARIDDLPRAAAKAVGGFRQAGAQPGDRVLLHVATDPTSIAAYLGALAAGLVAVPVDRAVTGAELERIYDAARPRFVWAAGPWAGPSRALAADDIADGPAAPPAAVAADALAALMATSGSTGQPRLVKVSHANLIANTAAIVRTQGLGPDDSAMMVLPLAYCFGASVVHSHLAAGGRIVCDRRFMFADKVLDAMNAAGCTSFAGVPAHYLLLSQRSSLGRVTTPAMRRWLQAGGPLAPDVLDDVVARASAGAPYVLYGQTEATARITTLGPNLWGDKKGSVGRALPGLSVRIDGVAGEVLVAGPSVTTGYWDAPAATTAQPRWLRTGDRGRLDGDGCLWLDGRLDDMAKIAGLRIALAEVERRLSQVAGVKMAAATTVPHSHAGEALAGFVVVGDGYDADAVVAAARQHLPQGWLMPILQARAELPQSRNGKIERHAVRQLACDLAAGASG